MHIALGDLYGFEQRYGVLPKLGKVFDMFRMIMPYDVKVVIIAQSPYPGSCPSTGITYACGPAFLPSRGCATTPMTLRNIILEICRDFSANKTKQPQEMLLDWIDQGVMLLNSSLTLGTNCPKYLEDHTILWQEIMQDLVYTICKKVDPVFVFVGKDAWKLENSVSHPVGGAQGKGSTRVIKVSHPVARKETPSAWYGSSVFSRVSKMMVERDEMPIKWM